MDIGDDYSLAAGIKELQALKRLYALLDRAAKEASHPDLGLVDVANISDAVAEVADEIEEREDALARYREFHTGELRHRAGRAHPG